MNHDVTLRDRPAFRWLVLALLTQIMLFCFLFLDILSPLKRILELDLLWCSAAFGTFSGAAYFLNVFAGFLLAAGFIIDRIGIRASALVASGMLLLGGSIEFYALTETFRTTAFHAWLDSWWVPMPGTAKLGAVGMMIFGSGMVMLSIVVSKSLVKWFEGRELASAMALEMSGTRIGMALAAIAGAYIYAADLFPFAQVAQPVLVGLLLLLLGSLGILIFCVLDRKLDHQLRHTSPQHGNPISMSTVRQLAHNRAFWLIAAFATAYFSSVFPFLKFAVDMLYNQLGMSETKVSLIFSLYPIGAAITTPFFGILLDRKGKGVTMLITGCLLMLAGHLSFAFLPQGGLAVPVTLVAVSLQALSLGMVTATIWPLLPRAVPTKYFGTALSLVFWIQNWGLFGGPIAIGKILDLSNPSPQQLKMLAEAGQPIPPTNYFPSLLAFAFISASAMGVALLLRHANRKYHWGMQLPNARP